jgi:hypothetical protein
LLGSSGRHVLQAWSATPDWQQQEKKQPYEISATAAVDPDVALFGKHICLYQQLIRSAKTFQKFPIGGRRARDFLGSFDIKTYFTSSIQQDIKKYQQE